MTVYIFKDQEQEYFCWVENNLNGYVVNTYRNISSRYMFLHRSSCRTIRDYQGRAEKDAFTCRKYIKVCALDSASLVSWIREHGGAGFTKLCLKCKPENSELPSVTTDAINTLQPAEPSTTDLLGEVMTTLASQRDVFHSEADFQHAFAWELHQRFPKSSVRLEMPLRTKDKTLHLDFLIQLPGKAIAVELKYKTKRLAQEISGEYFDLAHHGAHDHGGYDFIKDIHRLEEICRRKECCEGWAIMLTNDSSYWTMPKTSAYASFRLTEGRVLSGSIGWPEGTSSGTKRKREQVLQLDGAYKLNWRNYSLASIGHSSSFAYLAVKVV